MRLRRVDALVISGFPALAVAAGLAVLTAAPLFAIGPGDLWRAWPGERFVRTPAPCLRPAQLGDLLGELARRHPELSVREVGRSVQGRSIHLLTLGTGPRRVLLWSQMHGDETTATLALLDMFNLLSGPAASDGWMHEMLTGTTLHFIPLLNPDGAERGWVSKAKPVALDRKALVRLVDAKQGCPTAL